MQTRNYHFWTLFLGCFLLVGLFLPRSVVEASPDYRVTWEIDADFQNGMDDVQLIVLLNRYEGDELVDVDTLHHEPIPCVAVGDVGFTAEHGGGKKGASSGGGLLFTGGGYLACEMPSVVDIVEGATDGEVSISEACRCKSPWASAELNFAEAGENPIFYHPDVQFASPLVSVGETAALVQLNIGGEEAASDLFIPEEESNSVEAGYEWIVADIYEPWFVGNGNGLNSNPSEVNNVGNISNEATTIYFGYNPDSGASMTGTLTSVRVDPGCFGMG